MHGQNGEPGRDGRPGEPGHCDLTQCYQTAERVSRCKLFSKFSTPTQNDKSLRNFYFFIVIVDKVKRKRKNNLTPNELN